MSLHRNRLGRFGGTAWATLLVAGCTSSPPLWPLSEKVPAPPGYPSAIPRAFATQEGIEKSDAVKSLVTQRLKALHPDGGYMVDPKSTEYKDAVADAVPPATPSPKCNGDSTVNLGQTANFSPMLTPEELAAQIDSQNLYCAQDFAVRVAKQFAHEQRTLEAVNNGEALALVGLGTAAGVEGIVDKSSVPVRNIGLAAISIVGLQSALGLNGQRAAYEAGAKAMACLINLDSALDDAATLTPASSMNAGSPSTADKRATLPAKQTSNTQSNLLDRAGGGDATTAGIAPTNQTTAGANAYLASHATYERTADNNLRIRPAVKVAKQAPAPQAPKVHEAALNISELIPAVPKKSLGMNTAAAELAGSASYSAHAALSHVEDAQTEDDKLQTASAHLTDDGQRARNLHMAVMQIETAVADALYKNLDVTHIYSTAKMSYSALAGDVVAAQKSTKAAAGKVDAAGLKIAKAVGGTASQNAQPGDDSTPTTKQDVETVASALEQAKNDSAKTQNIADTFDSCVADATATPQTQTTPSTPEPGGGSNQ